jgi:uncharacterized protein (DUF427 family)
MSTAKPEEAVLSFHTYPGRVQVEIGGYLLAESDEVVEVRERGLGPRLYFPPASVRMSRLTTSSTSTVCPRKGEANYYNIAVGSCFEKDAVWRYESPFESASPLAGYLSFRDDAVDAFDNSGTRLIGPAACTSCDEENESQ